ncbi:MAG: hypothetical protein SFW67_05680, partial [Myxococcaceae bacterium]|nr:hypothetical protein [Myxococcaceae bacterium]
ASLGPSHRRSPCGLSFEAFVDRDLEVFVHAALGEPVAGLAESIGLSRQATHAILRRLRALHVG